MRRGAILVALLIVSLSILGLSIKLGTKQRSIAQVEQSYQPAPSALTFAEESDLQRFTQQAIAWVLVWWWPKMNCLQGNEIIEIDVAKLCKELEGQQIQANLITGERMLSIFLPALHIRIDFARLHEMGLGPPKVEFFCENSYEEYAIARKRFNEQVNENMKEAYERVKADPQIGKILEQIQKKADERMPKDEMKRVETITYGVPLLIEPPVEGLESWSEQKKQLYERIIAVVNKEVEEAYCESGNITKVTVPDFNIGDPSIYILIEMSPSRNAFKSEAYIEWIEFDRDLQSGEYGAHHVKTISRVDDLKRFRSLIEQRKIEELNILCPRKSIR